VTICPGSRHIKLQIPLLIVLDSPPIISPAIVLESGVLAGCVEIRQSGVSVRGAHFAEPGYGMKQRRTESPF
jgi:hypothetical protein